MMMHRYFILILFFMVVGCEADNESHIIPSSYQGMVVVAFGIKGQSYLSFKNNNRTFQISENGILRLADKYKNSETSIKFYREGFDGKLSELKEYSLKGKSIQELKNALAKNNTDEVFIADFAVVGVTKENVGKGKGGYFYFVGDLIQYIKFRENFSENAKKATRICNM